MSDRKGFKKKDGMKTNANGWMTTFSDLMSLLLTFFILLYSMSTIDVIKFKNISYSLQAVLMGEGQPQITEGMKNESPIPIDENETVSEDQLESTVKEEILVMYDKIKEFVEQENLEAEVSVQLHKNGVYIDIKDVILFESGKADIKRNGKEILNTLAKLFDQFHNEIIIEGRTDNVPMSNELYPTNWELSSARAIAVVRYLCEGKDIDPSRLSAIGYGEYRPVVPNDSVEHKAQNRRVNILILVDEESEEIDDN
ncbi:MAG: OmpA family protein [Eubacteriales bacterium]